MIRLIIGLTLTTLIGYTGYAGFSFVFSVSIGAFVLVVFRLINRLLNKRSYSPKSKAPVSKLKDALDDETAKGPAAQSFGIGAVILLYGVMAVLAALFYGLGKLVA